MDPLLATTLRALMQRQYWNAYRHILDENSFTNTNAAAIYALLVELHKSTKRNISVKVLRTAVDATTPGARSTELHLTVASIMKVTQDELDSADPSIRWYAARVLASQAARSVIAHGDEPSFDYAVPAALMGRAANIAQGQHEERTEARNAGLPGDPGMVRQAVPLGLHPDLDKELGGGAGRGELFVILAPPKRGKTSYLWRCVANAILGGENVVAYTMEIAKYKCFLRYYQALTGYTSSEMIKKRRSVAAHRARASRQGSLWVNDYSSQTFTPSMLEADLEQMQAEGLSPSYVMLDYLGLMAPSSGFGRTGRTSATLGGMVNEVRQIAAEFNVPILSAWQVAKTGVDKVVFTPPDIAESWDVIKIADGILGLNQGPMELANNVMRLKVMEQRESPSRGLYTLHSDMRRLIVRPHETKRQVDV